MNVSSVIPVAENMPILSDLHAESLKNPAPQAQHIAALLDLYVSGVLNCFNHRTNVNLNNRLICYDTKELGRELKKVSMLIVQDQVWSRLCATEIPGAPHGTTSTKCTCCSRILRRPPIWWETGNTSANGAAFPTA